MLVISCLRHTYRSFHGFICYLFVRSADGFYLIDALALRAYLRGDRTIDNQDLAISQLLRDSNIVKLVSGGANCLRMLWQEYGQINRYACVKAATTSNDDDQLEDHRVRPISAKIFKSLQEIVFKHLEAQKMEMLTDDVASKADDKIVQSELTRKLDMWRHQLAKFDDESAEFVLCTSLLNYICKNSSQVQHSQDLLNLCSEHHR